MKRVFALVLTVVLVAGLSAFAAEGDVFNSLKNVLGAYVDFNQFELAYCDDETATLYPLDDAAYEIAEMNCTVNLADGSAISLPVAYGDFLAAGWNPTTAQWASVTGARTMGSDTFANAAGETIEAKVQNPTQEERKLVDCWVGGVTVGGYYTAEFDVNGVSAGNTAAEVIAAFGLPREISYYMDEDYASLKFSYSFSGGYSMGVQLDPETGAVQSIGLGVHEDYMK